MANNEKKTAAERALKHNREWANAWRSPGRLAQSPAKRHNLTPGGPQARIMREEEAGWFPPGGVAAMTPKIVADPIVRQKHRRVRPDEIKSLGLMGEPYEESAQRPAYVSPQERALQTTAEPVATEITARPAGMEGITGRPAGVEGMTARPAPGALTGEYATGDLLGTSGFTATEGRRGEKPLTRYEDGKGGFLEATGTRKGGGTVSVTSGPGSGDYTKAEWAKMSGKERAQANVDSYKSQTQAIRGVIEQAKQGRQERSASGGALTGQQSPFARRKTLREYGMAARELKNDMRRGRISAKKGKVIAATLADHYDRALGGDLQKLMQEGVRQEGQLMMAQERSAGLLDVAEERQRGAAERIGIQGPERWSWQKSGQDPNTQQDLYTYAGDQGSSGAGTNQNPTDPAQLEVIQNLLRQKIEALPEEQRAAGLAEFARRFPGVEY